MLLGTLVANLPGNLLAGKGIVRTRRDRRSLNFYKKGKGIAIAGYGKEWDFQYRLIL